MTVDPQNGMFLEMGMYSKRHEYNPQPESAIAAKNPFDIRAFVEKHLDELDKRDERDGPKVRYVVMAFRPESSINRREKLLKIKRGSDTFKDLRKGINGLRGWRGFFSLKSLKAFSLFKVSREALGSRQNRKLTSK